MLTRTRLAGVLAAAVVVAVGVSAPAASAKMTSTQLEPKLCETKGGGKFVKIPGFPGEKIDRRLLTDIEWLLEKYKHKWFITDGYSTDPVHSRNGEHPIGLALDIIPNFERTRKWRKVSRLAKWAEPDQNEPRAPFRWVGYNGDAGHGRKDHLHLSWSHSDTRPEKPARTVYTIKCPEFGDDVTDPDEETEPSGGIGSTNQNGDLPVASQSDASRPMLDARIKHLQRTAVPEKDGADR